MDHPSLVATKDEMPITKDEATAFFYNGCATEPRYHACTAGPGEDRKVTWPWGPPPTIKGELELKSLALGKWKTRERCVFMCGNHPVGKWPAE